jgi:hypothetical protein
MERPMTLALRALHGEITLRVATSHVFKRTGISVVPVVHRSLSLSGSTLSVWVEEVKGLKIKRSILTCYPHNENIKTKDSTNNHENLKP